jgi:predicted DCC family thiol-disulfide oxidoreductase YuxK
MNKPDSIKTHSHIILFDGECNLCSGFLKFVYKRDKKGIFQFAWIQDEVSKEILDWFKMPTDHYDTIILIQNGKAILKSDAFLEIVKNLKFPWPSLTIGKIIPLKMRDSIYDLVAGSRYRWFGQKEACEMPKGDLRERFLSTN